ncbi:hypothetical protein N3K66_003258 [Trichothecium roseum]|uniref:Uncharacterized protein n=1 Tax=Trichothecium roseum TaxID=47278 RepID=A0ACC0V4Y6_9HYPO|nr:hypothetical protein N3K66_003258 [Trichothecium roseum]
MTSTASTATPPNNDFERRVDQVRSSKSNINELILNYLTMEGYPKAAANFCKEANLEPPQDEDMMEARQQIQDFILRGEIQSAIEALNELDPLILDKNESVHFALLRLQLVELIRACHKANNFNQAIDFARENLGPRAPTNPKFLQDLEMTMTLLFFPLDNLEPPLAALLKPDLRREVAERVNTTITQTLSNRIDTSIRSLISTRCWAENKVRESGSLQLPNRLDFGLTGEDDDQKLHRPSNGHEPMITI